MTVTNYLDYAGLQRFKTNLDTLYASLYRTETQVNGQIDAKLATFSQNYVQIVSDVPTIAGGAQEGIIYLVPDSNAEPGTFAYVAYGVETVSGEPKVVRIGAGTTTLPTVDSQLDADSENAVQNKAIKAALDAKVNTDDVTGTVASGETKVVTSGGVYTALQDYVTIASIASSVTSGDSNVVSGNAVATYVTTALGDYVETANVTSTVASGDTKVVTSGGVYTALQGYVPTSNVASTVVEDDTKVVTGEAVFDAIAAAMADIQTISDSDIDALFTSGSGS